MLYAERQSGCDRVAFFAITPENTGPYVMPESNIGLDVMPESDIGLDLNGPVELSTGPVTMPESNTGPDVMPELKHEILWHQTRIFP